MIYFILKLRELLRNNQITKNHTKSTLFSVTLAESNLNKILLERIVARKNQEFHQMEQMSLNPKARVKSQMISAIQLQRNLQLLTLHKTSKLIRK